MDYAGALAYLDSHVNLEVSPSAAARRLDRMHRLVGLMGDPQAAYPVIHLTGTNGKGSTARILTSLLIQQGLSVGTYTSPHLERINERLAWNGAPISDDEFTEVIEAVATLEPFVDDDSGAGPPTHFEILTAAAYRWFADIAVDVAVIEVGLGGRWDATNVADGGVAVVTNVSLDHRATIGPELIDIAREKAGIVKPGSTLVSGVADPELAATFAAAAPARIWTRDEDFGWTVNRLAHGGRVLGLFTPGAQYENVVLPLHGSYQGDNAAAALAAAEAFFTRPLDSDVVTDALQSVTVPGRLEVMGRNPLCVLDGAHNQAGAAAAATALAEAFAGVSDRVLVVGMVSGREPAEMLRALDVERARLVVACPPPSPRALPPG
ncbi:MAG: Mur ligase family protein, partial [Actinomycetota bacterium]|nr:Mur ligase family protein [Actinomycetota bacterium]